MSIANDSEMNAGVVMVCNQVDQSEQHSALMASYYAFVDAFRLNFCKAQICVSLFLL